MAVRALALFAALAAAGPVGKPLEGALSPVETAFVERVRADANTDAMMRHLSLYEHVAGSRGDWHTAAWVATVLRDQGLATSIHPMPTLLNYSAGAPALSIDGTALPTHEEVLPQDSTSALSKLRTDVYMGYSYPSEVQDAHIVFGGMCRRENFKKLRQLGVQTKGAIVLCRYGQIFRGLKVREAYLVGAVGVLLVNDPLEDGAAAGKKTWPYGPNRPEFGLQRGSVQFNSVAAGDPARAAGPKAIDEVAGVAYEDVTPRIPSLPVAARSARKLMAAMCEGGNRMLGPADDAAFKTSLTDGIAGVPEHRACLAAPGAKVSFAAPSKYSIREIPQVVAYRLSKSRRDRFKQECGSVMAAFRETMGVRPQDPQFMKQVHSVNNLEGFTAQDIVTGLWGFEKSQADAVRLIDAARESGCGDAVRHEYFSLVGVAGGLEGLRLASREEGTTSDKFLDVPVNVVDKEATNYVTVAAAESRKHARHRLDRLALDFAGVFEADDSVVFTGAHRDAWVFGATDPATGGVAMLSAATGLRGVGEAEEQGAVPMWDHVPLVMLSHSGEEHGMIGSTAFTEVHEPIMRKGLAYFNMDVAASGGQNFSARGSALLSHLIFTAASDAGVKHACVNEWDLLGSGSDFAAFKDGYCMPVVDVRLEGSVHDPAGEYPQYHSVYDSYDWLRRYGSSEGVDDVWRQLRELGTGFGLAAMRMATQGRDGHGGLSASGVFARMLRDSVAKLELSSVAPQNADTPKMAAGLRAAKESLRVPLARLVEAGVAADGKLDNAHGRALEASMCDRRGLSARRYSRNLYVAPDFLLGYGAVGAPGLADALVLGRPDHLQVEAEKLRSAVLRALSVLSDFVNSPEMVVVE